MTSIDLPGTPLTTSRLGFGCSALLGPRSRDEAHALLHAAFDAGLRHFDTARYYGEGDAEGVLGEFLGERRGAVTVAAALGVHPSPGQAKPRWLAGLVRGFVERFAFIRNLMRSRSGRAVRGGAFSVEEARESLATSRRELGVETIDLLLLHDAAPADCTPELLAFLEDAVADGKIRAFGVGTDAERVQTIMETKPAFARVIQFENNVFRQNAERLGAALEGRAAITHGALSGLGRLHTYLQARLGIAAQWSHEVGADCARMPTLAALMLAYALHTNPHGPVLFSSTRPDHVAANAASVAAGRFDAEQVERFADLVQSTEGLALE